MSRVVGHSKIRAELTRLFQRGAIPGALMFIGPEGIGRKLVALELASALLCHSGKFPGCGECDECRCLVAGTHPDCIVVNCKDTESWSTQGVRTLLSKLSLKPFGSKARVIVFDQVEELQIQALNVLLKTLEEPRPLNHFVLLSSNVSNVPTTVVSRCQRWIFGALSIDDHAEILSLLKTRSVQIPDGFSVSALYEIGDGTMAGIETTLQMLESWAKLPGILDEVALGKAEAAITFGAQFAKDRDGAIQSLRLIQVIARRRMREETAPIARYHWSMLLTNAVNAPRLISERYLSPGLVVSTVLLTVLKASQVTSLIGLEYPKLIEDIVQ